MSRPGSDLPRGAGHDELSDALGAYTVGALDPAERARVDAHLGDCPQCREQLTQFAGLPGLLSRLSAEEAAAGLAAPSRGAAERAAALIAVERRADSRRVRRWQALAAAALAAAALLALPLVLPGGATVPDALLQPRPAVAEAAGTDGSLAVTDRGWGMVVELELRGLPDRVGYSLVAVTDDDHRATAASWSATADGQVRLTGSCYVSRERLTRLEVVTPDGEVLVVFDT